MCFRDLPGVPEAIQTCRPWSTGLTAWFRALLVLQFQDALAKLQADPFFASILRQPRVQQAVRDLQRDPGTMRRHANDKAVCEPILGCPHPGWSFVSDRHLSGLDHPTRSALAHDQVLNDSVDAGSLC